MPVPIVAAAVGAGAGFLKKHPHFLPTLLLAVAVPVLFTILTTIGIISGIASLQIKTPPNGCGGGATSVILTKIATGDTAGAAVEAGKSVIDNIAKGMGMQGELTTCVGDGTWVYPLEKPVIITDFWGLRFDPRLCGNQPVPCPHSGIDLGAGGGTRILAASNGIVKQVGDNGTCGNSVVVEHPGKIWTLYCHIRYLPDGTPDIQVKVGDEVKGGQPIAGVGSTGNSSGDHLHFTVFVEQYSWVMGRYNVDPLMFMAQRGVNMGNNGVSGGLTMSERATYCSPNLYEFTFC